MSFSSNMKKLRIDRNLRQNDVAKLLNISQQALSKYENGEREPDIETLCKIANLYDITIDKLVERKWE